MNNTVKFLLTICLVSGLFVIETTGLVIKMDTAELTSQADCILIGKVTDLHSMWNTEGTIIYTYVTVEVDEYIKGEYQTRKIVFRNIGGEVGEIGLIVPDAPKFEKGEQVLLFLKPEKDNITDVVGAFQGKYTIEDNKIVEKGIPVTQFVEEIKYLLLQQEQQLERK